MPSYKELDQSPDHKQAEFLLSRLVRFSPTGSFNAYNLGMAPWQLVSDFPAGEQKAATELLLSAPLKWLENRGLVRKTQYDNYDITSKGHEAAQKPEPSFFANQEIMAALPLLHPDFQGYSRYFYDNRLKEAVAAAFERYENKLNEVRDSRGSAKAKSQQGRGLLSALFNEGILVRPYPKLGTTSAKAAEEGLTSMMGGALGWIRNPYEHEKHNLPDLTPSEALELLFVASYLMRMLELSKP
jgi:hypothetical protein